MCKMQIQTALQKDKIASLSSGHLQVLKRPNPGNRKTTLAYSVHLIRACLRGKESK
jgi:hypothetical protein